MIRQDHVKLLQLAKQMALTPSPAVAHASFLALKALLSAHSKAEELVVYKALDKLGLRSVSKATKEGEVEHALCDHLMGKLSRGKADSALWRARACVVQELLEHHVEEEHQEMLPLLEKHFDAEGLGSMARRFVDSKDRLLK